MHIHIFLERIIYFSVKSVQKKKKKKDKRH